jgi:cellulase/cellobiase CelA1
VSGRDCRGGLFCVGGLCAAGPGSTGLVHTDLGFSTDWGGGYCAILNVTNDASIATSSFSVELDTNGSAIYTAWSGTFSGASGAVTVSPLEWNGAVGPGQTGSSIGFCANRTSGGTAVPFVVNTTAT